MPTSWVGNRLRSMLLCYYPATLEVFPHLDRVVSLAFLQQCPTSGQAQTLDFEQLQAFLRAHHHTHSRSWPTLYAHLQADHPPSNPELEAAYSPWALAQARILETLVRSRSECLARLGKLFRHHPDREIFNSLPKAGALLAPALLAKLGDDRAGYPTPAVLQAVAGTCPVTHRSGKHTRIYFRTVCDHEFRLIAQPWARLTLGASPWAASYYHRVRPHCSTDSDAIRRVSR